jgi:chromate transporter
VVGVVLNLAVWFALHTLFRETAMIALGPVRFDAPVLASIDPWATLLAAAAVVAVFLLRANVIVTLLATSAAGILLHFLGLVG